MKLNHCVLHYRINSLSLHTLKTSVAQQVNICKLFNKDTQIFSIWASKTTTWGLHFINLLGNSLWSWSFAVKLQIILSKKFIMQPTCFVWNERCKFQKFQSSWTIHENNIQTLLIEIYKSLNHISPPICKNFYI